MKQQGFTLAEVLVTIGIIGIVSTLTLPALLQNYQNKVYESSLKKTANTVSNAVQTYMAMEDMSDLTNADFYNNPAKLSEFVDRYFKVVNKCGTKYNDGNKCFAETYRSLDKTETVNLKGYYCAYVVSISDGMSLCFDSGEMPIETGGSDVNGDGKVDDNDHSYNMTGVATASSAISIEVDINGVNGPNIAGRDLFAMTVKSDGLVYDPTYDVAKDSYSAWNKSMAAPMPIGRILANGWRIKY